MSTIDAREAGHDEACRTKPLDLLIRNGTVAAAGAIGRYDVGIRDRRIVSLGENLGPTLAVADREATHRAITFAELIDTPILVTHVSHRDGAEQIRWAQRRGLKVYGETCPQYLFLSSEGVDAPGLQGAKCVCTPPPRDKSEHEHIWRALRNGTFQVVSSDHSAFRYVDKIKGGATTPFTKVANGIPGIELRMPLLFSEGVGKGRITLEQFIAFSVTNAARIYGLYPRKGTISIGSDADLAIWDTAREWTVTHELLHDRSDYTPHEWHDFARVAADDAFARRTRLERRRGQGHGRKRPFLAMRSDRRLPAMNNDPRYRLAGRVILVTGAAMGIGRAMCVRLASEGARVACADLDTAGAAMTAREIGAAAIDIACDVTDAASARATVERTLAAFQALRGLIHNAARSSVAGTVVDLALTDWESEIAVSLTGAFLMSKFAVPHIAAAGGGSVVHIASQFARVAVAGSAAYCAAKAGLVNLAKAMARDHAGQNIRVNRLSPGAVATHRLLASHGTADRAVAALSPKHPIGRMAQPAEIAAAAAFLMSEDASFVTGSDLLVDGGYPAW